MPEPDETPRCPHCDEPLKSFDMPAGAGYDEPFHMACFNDECPYFKRGWDWMWSNYQVKASYRYRINPTNGKASPLAVWSDTALKDRITDG